MPAGILISAVWTQVSHGSLQPSTRNVQAPSVSSTTVAAHQSKPSGVVGCIGSRRSVPSGAVSTTVAFTASWPSRKTVARIGIASPTAPWPGRRRPPPPATPSSPGCGRSGRPRAAGSDPASIRSGPTSVWRHAANLSAPTRALPGGARGRRHGGEPRRRAARCGARLTFGERSRPTGRAARVLRVRAIRRFTVRPVLPEVAQAARRPRPQPALVLAPRHPGPVPLRRPRPVGVAPGTTRSSCWPTSRSSGCEMLAADKQLRQEPRGWSRPTWPTTSAATSGTRATPTDDPSRTGGIGYFSPGVRHHRGAAAVLRRPGDPGRRPPEGGQRPRRADHRRRAALPPGLLPAVAERRRLAAGALPAARPERAAADPAPRRGRAGPDRGAARWRPDAARPGLARAGRPGPAAADGLRRRAATPGRSGR